MCVAIINNCHFKYCFLLDFFRFGVGSEDEVVSGAIDGFSTRISLDVPIVYNQHHFTEFYVRLSLCLEREGGREGGAIDGVSVWMSP